MLTIETMREYGADVEEGLSRCMGNEGFYIKLVNMAVSDDGYSRLEDALNRGDLDKAFETAHSLKGMLGNLSITPLYRPVAELTELLRSKENADYQEYLRIILEKHDELTELAAS